MTGLQRSFTDDANRRILHKYAARLVPSDINSPVSSSILIIMGGVPACKFPGQEAPHRLNRSGGFEMPVWEGQPVICYVCVFLCAGLLLACRAAFEQRVPSTSLPYTWPARTHSVPEIVSMFNIACAVCWKRVLRSRVVVRRPTERRQQRARSARSLLPGSFERRRALYGLLSVQCAGVWSF